VDAISHSFSRLLILRTRFPFLPLAWTTMHSWQFTLISHSGKQLTHTQNVDQDTHATIFIDGDTADADTWKFVGYNEETQARRDWISQFSMFTLIRSAACTLL
jgi:hypothetical protein